MALAHSPKLVTNGLVVAYDASNIKGNKTVLANLVSNNYNAAYNGSAFRSIPGAIYIPGSGSYYSIPDSEAFNLGAGDWTIESWVWIPNSATANATENVIFSQSNGSAASDSSIYFGAGSATATIYVSDGVGWDHSINNSGTITPNRWQHVAASRQGNTLRLFINGTQVGVTTLTLGFTLGNSTRSPKIGLQDSGSSFTGYIFGLRLIKGTALYTTTFTPPSSYSAGDVAGTSLLVGQIGITDQSTFNHQLTATGTPSVLTSGNVALNGTTDLLNTSYPAQVEETIIVWTKSNGSLWNDTSWISSQRSSNGHIIHPNGASSTVDMYVISSSGAYTQIGNTTVTNINIPHMYSMSTNGSNSHKMYIDDALITTNTTAITRTTSGTSTNWNIGKDDMSGRYGSGSIYYVLRYNRQLTDAEIQQNFNALKGRYGL